MQNIHVTTLCTQRLQTPGQTVLTLTSPVWLIVYIVLLLEYVNTCVLFYFILHITFLPTLQSI